jgi:glycosyltransferase involved in cell wall biosynthesis
VTDPTAARPLVTFVLVTYNQQDLVREAVEGVFAQTYSPLEIILSDDCSPDGTFAILEEMAAAYTGPHQVRAVRTPRNLGIIQHVLMRGREAAGEIVVMGAGDDVSKPERVARLVEAFTPEVGAAYSLCDIIDENGALIRENVERGTRPKAMDDAIVRAMCLKGDTSHVRVTQGSTAAYRAELFAAPIDADRKPYTEEMVLCFYGHLLGYRVELVRESLVHYREHSGALTNVPDTDRSVQMRKPETVTREARRVNMVMFLDFHHMTCAKDTAGRINRAAIVRQYRENEIKFFWIDMSIPQRLAAVVSAAVEGNWRLAAWCLSRILGIYELVRDGQAVRR